jgi:hypothetical protein
VLKDSTVIEGKKVSENLNFIVIDVGGSNLSLLKSKIDTIINLDAKVSEQDSSKQAAPIRKKAAAKPAKKSKPIPRPPKPKPAPRIAAPSKPARPVPRLTIEQHLENNDNITYLDLSYFELDRLSPRIVNFKRLKHLDLKGNELSELPPEIGDMTTLETLDLRFNRIEQLPPQLSNLTGLRIVLLTGNRIGRNEIYHLARMLPQTRVVFSSAPQLRVKRNRPKALLENDYSTIDSLEKLCAAAKTDCCFALGNLFKKYSDYERAITAFEAGCPLVQPDTSSITLDNCEQAAMIYELIYKDRGRAKAFRLYICKMAPQRFKESCERLH